MRHGRRFVLAALAAAAMVATVPLAANADDEVTNQGTCSMAARWKLALEENNSHGEAKRVEASLTLRGAPAGSTWAIVMTDNGNEFFNAARMAGNNGTVRAHDETRNRNGKDRVEAMATDQASGEVCQATATLD
jgi:hypothetical protein